MKSTTEPAENPDYDWAESFAKAMLLNDHQSGDLNLAACFLDAINCINVLDESLSNAKSFRRRKIKELKSKRYADREELLGHIRQIKANCQTKHKALWERFEAVKKQADGAEQRVRELETRIGATRG